MSLCKCSVSVEVNRHRDYYDTATEALVEYDSYGSRLQIADDVREEMIKRDTIVIIQFYPDTPIGSYSVYHYDLDSALDAALACFESDTD